MILICKIILVAHALTNFHLVSRLDEGSEDDPEEGFAWISFSQDSKYVQVSRKLQRRTQIYSAKSFKIVETLEHEQIPRAIMFEPNGQLVVAFETAVDFFSLDELKCTATIQSPCNSVIANIFISPGLLGIVCEDGTCLLFNYSSDGKYTLSKSLSLAISSRPNWCGIANCSNSSGLLYSASFPEGEIACQSVDGKSSMPSASTSVNRIFGIAIVPESEHIAVMTEGHIFIMLKKAIHMLQEQQ